MHILVIEPDLLLGGTYVRALEMAGHTTTHVTSAQEAIHAADLRRPDMVVLELQLPGSNGIAFLHEFRSYADWREVPVVLHTYVMPHIQRQFRDVVSEQLGVVSWLYKPQTSLEQLLSTVRSHTPAS